MLKVRWPIWMGLLIVGLIAGVVIYLSRPDNTKRLKRISLQPSSVDFISLPQHADKLKIAVGAIISPVKSLAFYEDIFDYIGEKLGRGVEMVQRKTYAEVNFLIREGRIDRHGTGAISASSRAS